MQSRSLGGSYSLAPWPSRSYCVTIHGKRLRNVVTLTRKHIRVIRFIIRTLADDAAPGTAEMHGLRRGRPPRAPCKDNASNARDPVFCAERKGCGMCAVPKSRYVAFSATARHEAWMLARFLPIAHRIPNVHRRGNVDGIDKRIASSKGVNLWHGRQ